VFGKVRGRKKGILDNPIRRKNGGAICRFKSRRGKREGKDSKKRALVLGEGGKTPLVFEWRFITRWNSKKEKLWEK